MTPKSKLKKEALFVRVVAPDESMDFHDISTYIGRKMPFTTPRATLAMRVTDLTISFSLLHLTKRSAQSLAQKDVDFPRGPLSKLERHGLALNNSDASKIIVELDKDSKFEYNIEREQNGLVEIVGEDNPIELPKSAVQVVIHLFSKSANRPVIIGFIGHVGKPGTAETTRRITSMVLNSISQLPAFRILTEIETVKVPASPRTIARPVRKSEDKAQGMIPLWFYKSDLEPVLIGSGNVHIEIDLDQANPATGRLLFNLVADKEIEENFEPYRVALDTAINHKLRVYLGDDEVKAISTDIVLGEVATGTVERLKNAIDTMKSGFDLTPTQFRDHV